MKFYGLVAGVALTTAEVEGARNGNRGNGNRNANKWNKNNGNKNPNNVNNFGVPFQRPGPGTHMWAMNAAVHKLREQVDHAAENSKTNGLGLMSNMRNPAMAEAYAMQAENQKNESENLNDGSTDAEIAQEEAGNPSNANLNSIWTDIIGEKDIKPLDMETDEDQYRILEADDFDSELFGMLDVEQQDKYIEAQSISIEEFGGIDAAVQEQLDEHSSQAMSVFGGRPFPRPILKQALPTNSGKCTGKSSVGMCRGALPRWFYNTNTKTCESFTYGGCGGNENNYQSEEDCNSECVDPPTVIMKSGFRNSLKKGAGKKFKDDSSSAAACDDVLLETGWCRAYMPLWSYNKATSSCQQVISGGCGMETNNKFNNEDECMSTCARNTEPSPPSQDHSMSLQGFSLDEFLSGGVPDFQLEAIASTDTLCNEDSPCGCPMNAGFGGFNRRVEKFRFDSNSGKCVDFIYKGFGGNANRFDDLAGCNSRCIVSLELVVKPNPVDDDAKEWENRSGELPLSVTQSVELPSPCTDKKIETGWCRAMFTFYNFDMDTGKCERAVFGGCGSGTLNSFDSIEDCQLLCEASDDSSANQEEEGNEAHNVAEASRHKQESDALVDRCALAFKQTDVNVAEADGLMNFSRGFSGGAQLKLHTYYVFDHEKNRCKMVKYFEEKQDSAFDTENVFEKFGRCMQNCRPTAYAANAARRNYGRK